MAQHDYVISNAPGATVRADINALAEAIASQNAGPLSPSVTFANQFWYDTTNSLFKMRNPANSAWITIASISGSTFTLADSTSAIPASGSWFGTSNRFPFIDTSGGLEIGAYIDFHPDAAGTEDYRFRIARAAGANGAATITNTGSGGLDIVPGAGGFTFDGNPVATLPPGIFAPYGGVTAPTRWLFCYGQNVSRTTYAALFAAISTTYGVGDGSTTFTLPDLRGRTVAGKDNMGGVSADRLQGLAGGVNGDNLGAAGGLDYHYLSAAEMPSHTHAGSGNTGTENVGHTHNTPVPVGSNTADGGSFDASSGSVSYTNSYTSSDRSVAHTHAFGFTTTGAGSNGYHNNVQPTIILNYIIYAGV